jgi:hypothetical protein
MERGFSGEGGGVESAGAGGVGVLESLRRRWRARSEHAVSGAGRAGC